MTAFAARPLVGNAGFSTVPLVMLLAIDAGLLALGVLALRRRDLKA